MPDLQREREDLARANQHIADGERRVSNQILLIERMTQDGHNIIEAKKLLANYEEILVQWRWHRQLIIQEIARIEGI